MTFDDELFAALQAARLTDLVCDHELAERSREVSRRIREEQRRARWRAQKRRWLALFTGGAILLAGGGVAGANLLHHEPEDQDLVWCYRSVPEDLADDRARFAVLYVDADATTAERALEMCFTGANGTVHPVPDPISQCVLPDGHLAVIPVAQCSEVGLPRSDLQAPTPG